MKGGGERGSRGGQREALEEERVCEKLEEERERGIRGGRERVILEEEERESD